jgi:hypothetical protein
MRHSTSAIQPFSICQTTGQITHSRMPYSAIRMTHSRMPYSGTRMTHSPPLSLGWTNKENTVIQLFDMSNQNSCNGAFFRSAASDKSLHRL